MLTRTTTLVLTKQGLDFADNLRSKGQHGRAQLPVHLSINRVCMPCSPPIPFCKQARLLFPSYSNRTSQSPRARVWQATLKKLPHEREGVFLHSYGEIKVICKIATELERALFVC